MIETISEIFVFLYELFYEYADPIFRMELFSTVGWISLIIIPFVCCLIYYYIIGSLYAKYNSKKSWVIFMLATCCISALFALVYSLISTDLNLFNYELYIFMGSNFIYSALFYFIFSMIAKWWSLNSKCTPF